MIEIPMEFVAETLGRFENLIEEGPHIRITFALHIWLLAGYSARLN
jgi:hypothetical protein